MPLYEYECDACGGRFEVIQKFSETSTECRVCGKGPVRRLVAAPAFQFKGTGWYITDYAQKGKPAGEGGSGSKETSADKPAETKSADASSSSSTKSSDKPAASTVSSTKD